MKLFDQVSIRRKLILAIMLTVGPALLLALAAFLGIEVRSFRAAARRELSVLADVLAEGATAALDFRDPREAENLLATLKVQKRIVNAAVLDRNHRLFATYVREESTPAPPPANLPSDGFAFEGDHLWLTRPVRHSGETLGTIYLRSDLAELHARLRWGIGVGILLTLLIGGATLLFAMKLGGMMAEPILHLAETAGRVAERGDTRERVVRESQDEVGILVDAFNRMLDQLGERQALLEEAQRLAHLGSWAFDVEARTFEWSDETFRIFGLEPGPKALDWEAYLKALHPEDREAVERAVLKAAGSPDGLTLDHRLVCPDASVRWVHVAGARFQEADGRNSLRGTIIDITERKKAEDALHQAQKLESLGVLTGGIAHDFNNLLSALMGYLDIARMELPPGSTADEFLVKAETITRKAADFTRQMLAYSGKGRFEVKSLNLSRLVKEMGHLLSISISKKTELRYDLSEPIPAILADTSQIQQVIMNLVINASEALEGREGWVLLRTKAEYLEAEDLQRSFSGQELEPGLYTVVEVRDNGHGMDAKTLARIFDPFFTTKFHGRGLGLAAMLGIVKGHRGGIKVYSEPDKGTTFQLYFPTTTTSAEEPTFGSQDDDYRGSGLVLIVDDEPEIRDTASVFFRRMGFETIHAEDGREGLERYQEHRPLVRLVLLDLTMPHMDGVECFKILHALDPCLPVLMSSGFSEPDGVEELVGPGLAGFVQKPYRFATLRTKVREILG